MCTIHGIFPPTFETGEMTTQDLKRSATRPARMLSLLLSEKRWNENFLFSSLRYRIEAKPALDARSIRQGFRQIFLVPGGRYLITLRINLEIWDLSLPVPLNEPFASHKLRHGWQDARWVAISPSAGSDRIRIAIRYYLQEK